MYEGILNICAQFKKHLRYPSTLFCEHNQESVNLFRECLKIVVKRPVCDVCMSKNVGGVSLPPFLKIISYAHNAHRRVRRSENVDVSRAHS
jgi:hypothetical protein